jgi:tRNA pseudouridine55 synthase
MSTRSLKRDISGILLLDKPINISSNHILQRVKRYFNAKKAGHTGTLDPLATGMLPICFGSATKFSTYLLSEDKAYSVIAQLGVKTSTGDVEGDVISKCAVPSYSVEYLEQVIAKFIGVIEQIPPMYSALKHEGKPLYEYARKGQTIERKARFITIHDLSMISYDASTQRLELNVSCSKGTYIRTLVEDIAEAMDCVAHVIELRRTRVGRFEPSAMVTIDALEAQLEADPKGLDQFLTPLSHAFAHFPKIILNLDDARLFSQGQRIEVVRQNPQEFVAVYTAGGCFMGIGQVPYMGGKHMLKVCKLLPTSPDFLSWSKKNKESDSN